MKPFRREIIHSLLKTKWREYEYYKYYMDNWFIRKTTEYDHGIISENSRYQHNILFMFRHELTHKITLNLHNIQDISQKTKELSFNLKVNAADIKVLWHRKTLKGTNQDEKRKRKSSE